MDRLICGDVGFGKTEVALRAALQGGRRRQAGDDAGADDDPRPAALRHLPRAPRATCRSEVEMRLPLPQAGRDQGGARASSPTGKVDILIGTHRLLSRDVRAKDLGLVDRRRGAALRRQAEGAAAPAEAEGRRALAVGDADPAHAADEPRRAARHLGDRDAARGPAPGPHLRRRVRRGAGRAGDRARARARRPGLLPPQPDRHAPRGGRAAARRWCPGARFARGPRPDGRARARGDDARLPARRGRRAWCPRRSSSRASTSRPPTR